MIRYNTEVRVRYADTDQMKVVYHGKYLEYFELGRSALIRSMGLPYGEMEERGVLLPVVEVFARYRRPAKYDELLMIEASVNEIPKATLKIDYRVYRSGEGEPLAEGYSVHSFFNAATGKPMRAPSYFLNVIEKGMNGSPSPVSSE